MNSHGVEISIAGGGADETDDILSVAHWAFITGESFFGGSPGLLLQVKFHDGCLCCPRSSSSLPLLSEAGYYWW